jgi:putative ABC transport system permease protein
MVVIMITVFSMYFDTVSLKVENGVLYQVQEKRDNRYRSTYQKKALDIVEQAFDAKDVCMVSSKYPTALAQSDCRLITKTFSKKFNLEIIDGVNLQSKHFQNNQKVVVINKYMAHALFGDKDAIGQYFSIRNKKFKVVGVFQTLIKSNDYSAECYAPWTSIRHYVDGHSTAFIHAKNGENKAAIETRLKHYSADFDLSVQTLQEVQKQRSGKLLLMAFIFIGLSLLLPALLLTNLTLHRMETRLIELGVRRAFGANKKTIYYQLIVENILFTLFAGCFSLIIGQFFVSSLYIQFTYGFWNSEVPIIIFIYVLIVFLIFGVITGIIPARKVSRRTIIQSLNSK